MSAGVAAFRPPGFRLLAPVRPVACQGSQCLDVGVARHRAQPVERYPPIQEVGCPLLHVQQQIAQAGPICAFQPREGLKYQARGFALQLCFAGLAGANKLDRLFQPSRAFPRQGSRTAELFAQIQLFAALRWALAGAPARACSVLR